MVHSYVELRFLKAAAESAMLRSNLKDLYMYKRKLTFAEKSIYIYITYTFYSISKTRESHYLYLFNDTLWNYIRVITVEKSPCARG